MKRVARKKGGAVEPRWMLNEKTAPPVVALGAMAVVILLTLAFHLMTKPAVAPTINKNTKAAAGPNLAIVTSDGVTLAGNLIYPSGSGPWPVVILVHEFGQDRHQWDAYRDTFLGDRMAVLAYDTRGFGDSALANVPSAQTAFFGNMPNDLAAVVGYVRRQTNIDQTKIYVIGAALGANIAFVAAGSDLGITKTVLLSPSVNPQLDGRDVANFLPANIYGLASPTDLAALDTLMAAVSEPKKTTILSDSTARGAALLGTNQVINAVRQWLKE